MKKRVKQLFKIIRNAEAELKKIREKCPHKTVKVGKWSSRPGDIHDAKICVECGDHRGMVILSGDWFEPALDDLK